MRKLLLLIILLFSSTVFSQNGFNAFISPYTSTISTFVSGPEICLEIDAAGNKWMGTSNNNISNPAALIKYNKLSGMFNYYCSANTPAFAATSNRVQALKCDAAGNLWIGTSAGLIKYDGAIFKVYTTADGLPNNNINALESIGSQLYIGTNGGGLSRYNGGTFTNYNTGNSLLSNDFIYSIKAENANNIWLGINNQLILFNINSTFTFSSYTNYPLTGSNGRVNCFYIDGANNKWFGTSLKGLMMYDNTNFTYAANTYSTLIGANFPINCLDICKGPTNGVLITTTFGVSTGIGPYGDCLLELFPGGVAKTYYAPSSNFSLGRYIENEGGNTIFMVNNNLVTNAGYVKLMFSFNPSTYDGFNQGPMGVNNTNFKFLDINQVKAGIANRADMFWDIGNTQNASYEVPKGSGVHAAFDETFRIGGLDASNQLHMGAQTYRQTGCDFWPGPLDTINATIDTATCKAYDKIWKINKSDVSTFITQFGLGNVPLTYTPTIDILTWPAKGTGNNSRNLAPYVDVNNNGIYDPINDGDYPKIKGDQTLYCIFNDKLTPHGETFNALPMGVEVHFMAYAYDCSALTDSLKQLNFTTFYNYRIINRSSNNYHNVYVGLYHDIDLGNYNDDYIGCSVQDQLGFAYNADTLDENYQGAKGYLHYPAAMGSTVLKGPFAPSNDGIDNNSDGFVDEPNEMCLLNRFTYYNNPFSSTLTASQPPSTANQYYNYLRGLWRDGTYYTCYGNAYGGTTNTNYVYPWTYFPGNTCFTWNEGTVPNPKGDRRYIMSSGPFNFNAGETIEYEFANIWACDSSTTGNNIGSAMKLINDTKKIRRFYDSIPVAHCGITAPSFVGMKELLKEVDFNIYPNPVSSVLFINAVGMASSNCRIEITDVLGKTVFSKQTQGFSHTQLNISELNSGVYFINISSVNTHTVKKFVKQ